MPAALAGAPAHAGGGGPPGRPAAPAVPAGRLHPGRRGGQRHADGPDGRRGPPDRPGPLSGGLRRRRLARAQGGRHRGAAPPRHPRLPQHPLPRPPPARPTGRPQRPGVLPHPAAGAALPAAVHGRAGAVPADGGGTGGGARRGRGRPGHGACGHRPRDARADPLRERLVPDPSRRRALPRRPRAARGRRRAHPVAVRGVRHEHRHRRRRRPRLEARRRTGRLGRTGAARRVRHRAPPGGRGQPGGGQRPSHAHHAPGAAAGDPPGLGRGRQGQGGAVGRDGTGRGAPRIRLPRRALRVPLRLPADRGRGRGRLAHTGRAGGAGAARVAGRGRLDARSLRPRLRVVVLHRGARHGGGG